jgi:hypothetical protein
MFIILIPCEEFFMIIDYPASMEIIKHTYNKGIDLFGMIGKIKIAILN